MASLDGSGSKNEKAPPLGAAALPRHLRRRARSHHPYRYRRRPNLRIKNLTVPSTPGRRPAKRLKKEKEDPISTPITGEDVIPSIHHIS